MANEGSSSFAGLVDELPDDVKAPLLDFDLALREVEEQVAELTERDWGELTSGMSPLEVSRLNVTCAYTLNTLFFIYLKTQGLPTSDHPVKQELDRVRQYLKKVKGVSNQAAEQKANVRLNAEAARRFITHALSDPGAPSTPAGEDGGAPSGAERARSPGDGAHKNHRKGGKSPASGGGSHGNKSKKSKKH
jgi:exosome complex protein LRP1